MRIFKVIIIFCLSLLVNFTFIYSQNESNTLAVLPFENAPEDTQGDSGKIAAEIFTSQLADNTEFLLIERMYIDKIYKEQGFSLSDAVGEESSIKIGKLLGAKYLLLGNVTFIEALAGMDDRNKGCCMLAGCVACSWLGCLAGFLVPTEGYRVGFSVRIVETESGIIVFTGSDKDEGTTLHEAMEKCSRKIVSKIKNKFKKK